MLLVEIVKFIIYAMLIVIISKYVLVKVLRKLAQVLNLSSKAVGNIAGIATSMPELITTVFSAFAGLIATSIYNILSSNIINLIQYIFSIFLNKNQKKLKNKALKIDIVLVLCTILIPIAMLFFKMDFNISIVPLFIILFVFFYYLNVKVHKLYLQVENGALVMDSIEKKVTLKRKIVKIILYINVLLITGGALYLIGENLNKALSNLCNIFKVPEVVLGFSLGFITSIPELITFFESQKEYKKLENKELGVIEATNNLLTSNILNLFVIQTISIMIFTIIWI